MKKIVFLLSFILISSFSYSADTLVIKDTTITVTHTNLKTCYTTPVTLLPTLTSDSFYVVSKIIVYKIGTEYTTAPTLLFKNSKDGSLASVNISTSGILAASDTTIQVTSMESALSGTQILYNGSLVLKADRRNPAGATTSSIKIYIQYYTKPL